MNTFSMFACSMSDGSPFIPTIRLGLAASLAVICSSLSGCGSSNSTHDVSGNGGAGGIAGATGTGGGGGGTSDTGAAGRTGIGGATILGGAATTASGGGSGAGGSTSAISSAGTGGGTTAGIGGDTTAGIGGGGTTGAGGSTKGGVGAGGTTDAGGNTKTGVGGGGTTGAGGSTKASGGSGTAGTGGSTKVNSGGTTSTGGTNSTATGGTSPSTSPASLYNGIQWADSSGNPIQAHGGGVIKVGDYYYWFGENRNTNGTFYAVSCYRSADLVHWEFRNNVLTQNSDAGLKPANIERPKVIYNATTKKYVMWMHWENGSDYSASRAGVASCDTVDGNYTYHGAARPMVDSGVVDHSTAGYQSRDCTAFVDTDDKGYFLSASNENYDLNLYLLSIDYLSIDSLAATLFKGGHREAPALFKRNNVYFLITSAATGWDPNQAQYATSSSLTTGWSSMTNTGDSTTYYSQSTFVVPVQGSSGTAYLYMGDRWAGAWSGIVNDSTYIWLPISFSSNTAMSMSWSNTITIDAAAGSVTGATNKFVYLNKASGLAMSIENASTADNAKVVQATPGSGKEQQWSLNYDSNGYFKVTNANSSRVLDVTSSSTADGASIIQYTDNDGDNQKWRVVDKGAGYYQLLNKHSSKVAEVPASSTTAGATLDQKAASGTADNQLWQMNVAK